ncbi:hypothetical protein FLCU109888_08890 [Flavobacterium cucumis]|uniref:DUF6438 domain-containing protein n=1 Tax=Flavobacterium cucumis TaxID=416016 RepID=A0A1M7ZY45_9FLAO|nr:hypothetical protein [Flavobacterium cucumis]SHO73788.1 hypothetical protein SAMN05443547_2161 [Flavobacterium cucumis]
MKKIICLALVSFFISCKKESKDGFTPTKIDSLASISEVENFIKPFDSSFTKYNYRLEMLKDSTLSMQPYCKGDFDNNGYTDLFVAGKYKYGRMYPYAFMNYGNDSINHFRLHESGTDLIPKVIRKNNHDLLVLKKGSKFNFRVDTLIYKYRNLINYNSNPKKYNIEKITFNGFNIRGEYEIVINQNHKATFKLSKGINDTLYHYKAERGLSSKEYTELIDLLNYMDFPSLKEKYFERSSSHIMCDLTISYNNGKIKHIFDHGMENHYSLKALYSKFEDLKNTVQLRAAGYSLISEQDD